MILGLLHMVEGIPVFFAAGKCGIGLMIVMSISLAISTIATYVYCVSSRPLASSASSSVHLNAASLSHSSAWRSGSGP